MNHRSVLVKLVALITLGSGLINLYSLLGPSLPERLNVLQDIFPLEFIHLSKFLILIIGFALVIAAINVYKRKRRAFWATLLLAVLSIVFHLTKGLDYEEAIVSFVLLTALLTTRRHFTVRSSVPSLRWGLLRLAAAFALAMAYGTAGFWFVEHHHFHINFRVPDALKETLRFLILIGDPNLTPHTHYARWFMDSLYLMTVTTIAYSLYALFRPVIYRVSTHVREIEQAKNIVEKYGRSALDYFKCWPDKSFFFSASQNGFVAYGVGKNFAATLADPVGPPEEMEAIIREFAQFCEENDWGVGFHEALPDFLPIYERLGFRKLKMGDEAIVDLTAFDLEGKERKQFRQIMRKVDEIGIVFVRHQPPISGHVLEEIKEVSDEWLRISGRRERRFTVGRFEADYVRTTEVFTALDSQSVIQAFVNLIPSYGPSEATIDLMRRRYNSPNGIMDYLFIKLFLLLKGRGFRRFNLGLAPMAGFRPGEKASPEEKAIHFFFQHLNFLFSYKGLWHYKAKFASFWEPRYVIYRSPLDLPRIAIALRELSEFKA